MKAEIIREIEEKAGIPGLAHVLTERLSGSELNSLLLEVFAQKVKNTPPRLLLQQYLTNPFVHPADTDMIGIRQMELETLRFLRDHSFQPVELSPAAQLGSCSVVGTVSQDKIVSAIRNTEIMADATNGLALYIAGIKKSGGNGDWKKDEVLRYCTVHQHLRTQPFKGKGYTAHFKIGCIVTSGKDSGSYRFECIHLLEHLATLEGLLKKVFGIRKTRIRIQRREGYPDSDRLVTTVVDHLKKNGIADVFISDTAGSNNYYKGLQFKVLIEVKDGEREIADGGFVDWTQKLLGNKKERLLISGIGLALLHKFQSGSL